MSKRWYRLTVMFGALLASAAHADNFSSAHYDARTDELVVTLFYRGTNPNHTFQVQWGECQKLGRNGRQIAGDVLDNQWNDAALRDYRITVRFKLTTLTCRPARVTLRTAPRFFYTVYIPAASRGPT
jgi:hypothetical protein